MPYYDNTRISSHDGCARRYFFRHELDWTTEGMSPPLGFGLSWHSAMDYVWANAREVTDLQELAKGGYAAFAEKWMEEGMPDPSNYDPAVWEPFKQRTPDTAAEMLVNYIPERLPFILEHKVIAVEQPFVVPLYPHSTEFMYCGRLDKVIEDVSGYIWIVDHKTSSSYSKAQGFQASFTDSFTPDSQIEGYAYAGAMLYGDKFRGVWIDAALVWRTRHDVFGLIPVERNREMLDCWLAEVRIKVEQITDHKRRVYQFKDGWKDEEMPNYLPAFTKDSSACFDWNSPCVYLDLCKAHGNPLKIERPFWMIEEKWSPFERTGMAELGMEEE